MSDFVPASNEPRPGDLPHAPSDARRLLQIEGYIERDPELREPLERIVSPLAKAFAEIDKAKASRTFTREGLAQKKNETLAHARASFFDLYDKATASVSEDAALQRVRVQHMTLNPDGKTWSVRPPSPPTPAEEAIISDVRRHLMTLPPKDARNVYLGAVNARDHVTIRAAESLPPSLSFIDTATKEHAARVAFEGLSPVLQQSVLELERQAAVREAVSEHAVRLIRER